MSDKHLAVNLEHQVSQSRQIKGLNAENNRLRSKVSTLEKYIEKLEQNNEELEDALAKFTSEKDPRNWIRERTHLLTDPQRDLFFRMYPSIDKMDDAQIRTAKRQIKQTLVKNKEREENE